MLDKDEVAQALIAEQRRVGLDLAHRVNELFPVGRVVHVRGGGGIVRVRIKERAQAWAPFTLRGITPSTGRRRTVDARHITTVEGEEAACTFGLNRGSSSAPRGRT